MYKLWKCSIFFLKDRISFLAHAGLGCTNKSPFYFCLPSVGTAGMSHDAQFLKYSVDLAQNGEGVRTQSPNSLSAHHRPRGWGCCLSICLPSRKTTTPLPTVIVLKRITPPLPPPHTHTWQREEGEQSEVGQLDLGISSPDPASHGSISNNFIKCCSLPGLICSFI